MEDLEDDKDWMSVASSDDGKTKARSSGGNGSKKTKAKTLTKEQKAETRKANGPVAADARKIAKVLDPAVKDARKCVKHPSTPQELKDELSAASAILRDCKKMQDKLSESNKTGKLLEPLKLSYDEAKDLAKSLKHGAESAKHFASLLSDMTEEKMDQLKAAADRAKNQVDVD